MKVLSTVPQVSSSPRWLSLKLTPLNWGQGAGNPLPQKKQMTLSPAVLLLSLPTWPEPLGTVITQLTQWTCYSQVCHVCGLRRHLNRTRGGAGLWQRRQGALHTQSSRLPDPPLMEARLGDAITWENLCQGMVLVVIKVCLLRSLITWRSSLLPPTDSSAVNVSPN